MSEQWHDDHKKAIAQKWTQCPPVTAKVKELISGQVCMGTYGLVELEVMQLERELAEARAEIERLKAFIDQRDRKLLKCIGQKCDKNKLIEQLREALDATDEYYLDKSYAGEVHNTPIVVKVREAQAALSAAERISK